MVAATIVAHLSARGGNRKGSEVVFRCPFPDRHANGDKHPSARYNVEKRVWHCDVCNEGGGLKQLADVLGVECFELASTTVSQVRPAGIPTAWKGHRYSQHWTYRDAIGRELGHVARFDTSVPGERKQVVPFFTRDGNKWTPGAPASPSPLFGLDVLAAQPTATVYVVEGEKCAAAIHRLVGVATTSQGGAQAAGKSDWSPLAGRQVVIWPDNDAPGQTYAADVTAILARLTPAPKVKQVDVSKIGLGTAEDVFDWLTAHPNAGLTDLAALPVMAPTKTQPSFTLTTITADELMRKQFTPPRWAVRDLIPEGLTLLAGAPKGGKSWLMLGVAYGIACGGYALGNIRVDGGEVLYCGLEDSQPRMQKRIAMLMDDMVPKRLHIVTSGGLKRIDQGGIEQVKSFLAEFPQCRLIVIDTLARVRPQSRFSSNAYQEDSDTMSRLQMLALAHGVAIVVVHHLKKQAKGTEEYDIIERISGSMGLSGVADAVLILERKRRDSSGKLFVTGRDIEEGQLPLTFDSTSGAWVFRPDTDTDGLTPVRSLVRSFFIEATSKTPDIGTGHRPDMPVESPVLGIAGIASALGRPYDATRKLLKRMELDGDLVREAGGYSLPTPSPLVGGVSDMSGSERETQADISDVGDYKDEDDGCPFGPWRLVEPPSIFDEAVVFIAHAEIPVPKEYDNLVKFTWSELSSLADLPSEQIRVEYERKKLALLEEVFK